MRDDYLLTISGHNTFREVELSSSSRVVRVGTTQRCDVRYRQDLFFAPFELEFESDDAGAWTLSCSDTVYVSEDEVKRLAFTELKHGCELAVKYVESASTLFWVRFAIDFERERGAYDRYVDLSRVDSLTIGGMPTCNLSLGGPYVGGDMVVLERHGADQAFYLEEQRSRYGVLVDGRRLAGSTRLEDRTFFSLANYYFYYRGEKLFFSRTAGVSCNGIAARDRLDFAAVSDYPLFNRNTRVRALLPEGKISVLEPPAKEEPQRQSIVVQLLPAVGMLAITVLIRGQMATSGNSSSAMAMLVMSVASIGLGVVTSVVGIVSERRQFKERAAKRISSYNAYIEQKRSEVERARKEELSLLSGEYPAIPQELEKVRTFSGDLFDRRPADDDFLNVRLGQGSVQTRLPLDVKHKEALELDELAAIPVALKDEFSQLEGAPVTLELARANAVGVVGRRDACEVFLRTLVVDICSRQYESECRIFFVVEEENEPAVHWARSLPHLQNKETNTRNVACDAESRNVVFELLFKELTAREEACGSSRDALSGWPHLVVFVLDECGLKNHPVSRFIDDAARLAVTFVFFDARRDLLPMGCDHIITLEAGSHEGMVVDAHDSGKAASFTYDEVSLEQASEFARTLAPVYCEEISLEGTLTRSITMFEMLGIIAADDLDLGARWASSDVCRSLAAPIGVTKSRMISLDLHDKADGPHGLVAGTTGSGKSEILQTYILSIATLFHPYEVAFVIIDFKGGGMVNQLRGLPHLVGAITNIDGREIDRSLKSIKAELRRRQRLFAEEGVNHISDYIRRYKAGKAKTPLPHLVIIVDEFAELKAEQPEFMAELISASRIGRSLGVHLILATQKPSGQVSDQIWSNSRFKLCLKVQSQEDSNEVLKSPLAAEIKEPGRAYLQVGNNEVFELLQSAYSGGPEHTDVENVREFTLFEVENSGKRVPIYQRKRRKSTEASLTQLDAIVAHVGRFCEQEGIERLPSICLPPLPESIVLPEGASVRDGRIALGIYDDPDNQYQGEALFDLDNTNAFILGSSQTGKTNLLQTIVRIIAGSRSPREASFYIMDFASMILKNLEGLVHVGGVVLPGEDEKLKNLFKLLSGEISSRKKRLLDVGVSSFAAYLEAGYDDLPHIYVLLDNFAVFRELYAERYDDALISICRDGVAYGVTVVVANSATSGFGFKYMTNFSTFIALPCNDSNEYSMVFDRCRMQPKAVPGRALCSFDKQIYEMQTYLGFEGEREVDRVAAMRTFVERANSFWPSLHARRIPSVPDDLALEYLYDNYEIRPNEIPLALDYGTVEPVRLDLNGQFSIALVGGGESESKLAVNAILEDVRRNYFDRPAEVYLVDGLARELAAWRDVPFVASYTADGSGAGVVLEQVSMRLEERYARVAEEGLTAIESEPYLVAILNSREALDFISDSKDLVASYQQMKKKYAAMRVLFVFAGVPNESVGFSAPALLKELKDEKRGLTFGAIAEQKFYDVNGIQARALKGDVEDGQAFYVNGSDLSKVRLPREKKGE